MRGQPRRFARATDILRREAKQPFFWLVAALVAVGVYLRLHAFGFPERFLFDEHHFVENARNYLLGRADWNDHPPLGKLIIAAFMRVLGDDPVGWRAASLVSGLGTIAAGSVAAARLFGDPRAGVVAAALLGSDGFLISYSRVALLDGALGTCAALAALIASSRMGPLPLAAAVVLAGCASSVKFTGVLVLVPLAVAVLLAEVSRVRRLVSLAVLALGTLAIYVAWFMVGLALTGEPSTITASIDKTLALLEHHARLTDMKHPLTSGWVTWSLPTKPILLGKVDGATTLRALSSLGNRATWWAAVGFGAAATARLTWVGLRAASSGSGGADAAAAGLDGFLGTHGRAVTLLLASVFGFLAPWVLTHRDSYIYHFLPSYVGLILLLSGYVAASHRRRPALVAAWLAAVLGVLAVYAPVWSFMPIPRAGVTTRVMLDQWR